MSSIASSWSSKNEDQEMMFLEDQSQPLRSPLSVDGVTERLSVRLSVDVEGSP